MSEKVYLEIWYDIKKDEFTIQKTNIKKSMIKEIVEEFLGTQVGKGVDESTSNKHDVYVIMIQLDLSCDHFSCSSNCGNLGLMEGLLLKFLLDEQV